MIISLYIYIHVFVLRRYATSADVGKTGGFQLRMHQLPHRADFGLRGTSDHVGILSSWGVMTIMKHSFLFTDIMNTCVIPSHSQDVQRQLAQLIMLHGFSTNSDCPGTEKLVTTWVQHCWLSEGAPLDIELHPGSGDLKPHQVFCVKGWNRAVCSLACLYAMFQRAELLEAWSSW